MMQSPEEQITWTDTDSDHESIAPNHASLEIMLPEAGIQEGPLLQQK